MYRYTYVKFVAYNSMVFTTSNAWRAVEIPLLLDHGPKKSGLDDANICTSMRILGPQRFATEPLANSHL